MADVSSGPVVVFEASSREVRVDVRPDQATVWPSQRQMGELSDTSTDCFGLYLKNVLGECKLDEAATTEVYSVVQTEGRRRVKHYILDAITSIGYRVIPKRETQFRVCATRTLSDLEDGR